MNSEDITAFLKIVITSGKFVKVKSRFKILNSPDDAVLRTAYDGRADFIVTGDKHLLELKQFKDTKIVTVTQAFEDLHLAV